MSSPFFPNQARRHAPQLSEPGAAIRRPSSPAAALAPLVEAEGDASRRVAHCSVPGMAARAGSHPVDLLGVRNGTERTTLPTWWPTLCGWARRGQESRQRLRREGAVADGHSRRPVAKLVGGRGQPGGRAGGLLRPLQGVALTHRYAHTHVYLPGAGRRLNLAAGGAQLPRRLASQRTLR